MAIENETRQKPNMPEKTKTLLLAEDDRATQSLLCAGLRALSEYNVMVASNGLEALEIIKKQSIDVLVTDLQMPVMDGFQLISIVYERYPHIPVLVMTGLPEALHQNVPMFLGALCILPKPVKLPTLIEQIREAGNRKPDGMIIGLPLNSLLQLMEWERKSCTVKVKSNCGVGMLYLHEGALIHANYMELEGLEAVYEILALTESYVEFTGVCRADKTIAIPLTEVLLNVAMNNDNKLRHV